MADWEASNANGCDRRGDGVYSEASITNRRNKTNKFVWLGCV